MTTFFNNFRFNKISIHLIGMVRLRHFLGRALRLGQARGRAPRLGQAREPGAAATWSLISMSCIRSMYKITVPLAFYIYCLKSVNFLHFMFHFSFEYFSLDRYILTES